MKPLILLVFLVALLAGFSNRASAQVDVSVSAHAVANTQNQVATDNIGLAVALGYTYKGVRLSAEGFGNDSAPGRARYTASAKAFKKGEYQLDLGGGFWRFGNDDGGFGQAIIRYDEWSFLGRAGNDGFVEAEAAYRLAEFGDHLSVLPFYRFTRHEVAASPAVRLHQIGLRLGIK